MIFAPAMRYLELFAKRHRDTAALAYHDSRWRRDKAPLLDHLGAVIDRVQAHSRGGACNEANFVTSCNKCNTRKSDALPQDFGARSPLRPIRGKYGEPEHWDGLSTLFIILVEQAPHFASPTERDWLHALRPSHSLLTIESE